MALLLKNVFFAAVVPSTVAGFVPILIAGGLRPAPLWRLVSAVPFFVAGMAVVVSCVADFGRHGRGTPFPLDPPKNLVVRGLYRRARNPMYAGVLTILTGWLVLYPSLPLLIYALAVGLAFHGFVVLYEEPHLRRVFGSQYEDYERSVGRWIPRW